MTKKITIVFLGLLLLGTSFYFYSCQDRNLRGWWKKSSDGKTYLVVDDPDGSNCPPIFVDGRALAVGIGERSAIEPGEHSINCGVGSDMRQGIGFNVPAGVEYHFDYWGP